MHSAAQHSTEHSTEYSTAQHEPCERRTTKTARARFMRFATTRAKANVTGVLLFACCQLRSLSTAGLPEFETNPQLVAVLPAHTQADLSPSAQTRTRAATDHVVCQTQQPCRQVNLIKASTRSSLMSNVRAAVHDKHTIAVNDGVQTMRNSKHLHPEHNKHEYKHPSLARIIPCT
jgi:hypothetical protein